MYNGKRILALIPARGGSVGIPHKNIYPLCGKPLIMWTIDEAVKSNFLDDIYCSTNDEKIAEIARTCGKCQIIKRPDELATNTSKTIDAVLHAIETLEQQGKTYDYLLLLQPTSPLRTVQQIDGFVRYAIDHNLPSCVSVSKIPMLPVLIRDAEYSQDGTMLITPIVHGGGTVRRQDAKANYYVNGSLYLYSVDLLKQYGTEISMNDAPYGYEIELKSAIDVDTYQNLEECREILNKRKR